MTLRMLKLARGGHAAEAEMQRMMTEKGVAFAEAAATLATGGSMNKVVRRVRSRVNQNKRRLSRYAPKYQRRNIVRSVIPARAGIQFAFALRALDSGVRRNDECGSVATSNRSAARKSTGRGARFPGYDPPIPTSNIRRRFVMSIFGDIMSAIFGRSAKAETPAAGTPGPCHAGWQPCRSARVCHAISAECASRFRRSRGAGRCRRRARRARQEEQAEAQLAQVDRRSHEAARSRLRARPRARSSPRSCITPAIPRTRRR